MIKLVNSTIVNAILDPVLKLLTHTTDLVRKKAYMVLNRINILLPGGVVDYDEKMKRALCDKEPSVMGAALTLYKEVIKTDPLHYKDSIGSFVLILK